MTNKKPLYELGPCTLGGIEGQGWGDYKNSGMTHNLAGSVFFEPDKLKKVKAMFHGSDPIFYEGPVYENGTVSQRHASVQVKHMADRSDDSPGRLRKPYVEGHPRVDYLGPGDPFV